MTTLPTHLARPSRLGWLSVAVVSSLVAVTLVIGALSGPADIAMSQVFGEVASRIPGLGVESALTEIQQGILWSWRFPRVVLGMMVGGTLAISGASYQGVFRNPLADPYLLGIAAGAALGATLAIVSGLPAALLVPSAFVGGVGAVAATFMLGRTMGDRSATTLILAGVAMASFLTALTTFVQQRNSETLREVFAWILGRLSTSGWAEVGLLAPYAAVSILVMLSYRRTLDMLAVGDTEAASLGVDVNRVRTVVVLAATAGTAAAVAVSGLIAFVGIIVPHAVRLFVGTSYRVVLPLSLLSGAGFLVAADIAARGVMAPAELPIGVVTSFLGAPFFVLVLRTSRRSL
jgi:iron complex transport system permease protein